MGAPVDEVRSSKLGLAYLVRQSFLTNNIFSNFFNLSPAHGTGAPVLEDHLRAGVAAHLVRDPAVNEASVLRPDAANGADGGSPGR